MTDGLRIFIYILSKLNSNSNSDSIRTIDNIRYCSKFYHDKMEKYNFPQ